MPKRPSRRSRRRFLKAVPAAIGVAAASPAGAQTHPRVGREVLECGEALTGVDFEPAETDLMLDLVNTNRDHAEAISRFCRRYRVPFVRAAAEDPFEDVVLRTFREGGFVA